MEWGDYNMSAYIVDNKTINVIVFVLRRSDFMAIQIKEKFNIDIKTDKGISELAHRLYALNVSGVGARYGSADDMVGAGFEYKPEYNHTQLEAYKNLKELMYQCAEGEVVESKLYKFFNNSVHKHFADEVITNMPDYYKD